MEKILAIENDKVDTAELMSFALSHNDTESAEVFARLHARLFEVCARAYDFIEKCPGTIYLYLNAIVREVVSGHLGNREKFRRTREEVYKFLERVARKYEAHELIVERLTFASKECDSHELSNSEFTRAPESAPSVCVQTLNLLEILNRDEFARSCDDESVGSYAWAQCFVYAIAYSHIAAVKAYARFFIDAASRQRGHKGSPIARKINWSHIRSNFGERFHRDSPRFYLNGERAANYDAAYNSLSRLCTETYADERLSDELAVK